MLDTIAHRYHVLPSRVLREADSLDFHVLDVAVSYERYLRERETGNKAAPDLSVNNMQDMINKVRRK